MKNHRNTKLWHRSQYAQKGARCCKRVWKGWHSQVPGGRLLRDYCCLQLFSVGEAMRWPEDRRKMAAAPARWSRWGQGCRTRVEMGLLALLVYFPLCVLPYTHTQELEFLVTDTCVTKEQSKTSLTARNAFALVGCHLQMLCRYRVSSQGEDYCAGKNDTSLTVAPSCGHCAQKRSLLQERMRVLNRTKCAMTVEFTNLTAAMAGLYTCKDTVNWPSESRTIEVGEAPVVPSNVSVVYSPSRSIVLRLNPVKTATDLNVPTKWSVNYTWWKSGPTKACDSGSSDCRKRRGELCTPCVIRLRNYSGCGQYTNVGFLDESITFHIVVSNMLGQVSVTETFHLSEWVKPRAIGGLDMVERSESSLKMRVTSAPTIDVCHYESMNRSGHPLKLQWTVDLVSARNQTLAHAEGLEFFTKYGFVRNLEDDEAALNRKVVASFPKTSKKRSWKSTVKIWCSQNLSAEVWKVRQLPFHGYCYNVSVQSFGRFPGNVRFLKTSATCTEDSAPSEGPQLHDSFAYCDTSKTPVSCVLNFKEIPRSKRGSAAVRYTATVTAVIRPEEGRPGRPQNNSRVYSLEAGVQCNSLVLRSLEAGRDYAVRLQATNDQGASPVSAKMLRVWKTLPPTAPRNIVLETRESQSEWSYKLTWADGGGQVPYYVHHCNATSLQLEDRAENVTSLKPAMKPLNCVTNMVVKSVDRSNKFKFRQSPRAGGLQAAFFVSSVSQDGVSSGLQKVDCFYKSALVPEKVNFWFESGSHGLRLEFSLPCGPDINYQYGRPRSYAVGIIELTDSGLEDCGSRMQQSQYYSRKLTSSTSLQDPVRYEREDLEPDTWYLVGVTVAGTTGGKDEWVCKKAKTAKDGLTKNITIAGAVVGVICIAILIFCLYRRTKRANKMFGQFTEEDFAVPEFQQRAAKTGAAKSSEGEDLEERNLSINPEALVEAAEATDSRYSGLPTSGGQWTQAQSEMDDEDDDEDDSDSSNTEDERDTDSRGSDHYEDIDEEDSEDNAEEGGAGDQQPLIHGASRQGWLLQQAERNSSPHHPASPIGTPRDSLLTNETPWLGSNGQLECQPQPPEGHDQNAFGSTPPQSVLMDKAQPLEADVSVSQGACQNVPLQTDTVGSFSIDAILQDFENSQNMASRGSGAGGCAYGIEAIRKAAAMCPWRDCAVGEGDHPEQGAALVLVNKLSSRDSACFSSSMTGSSIDSDTESKSGTVNS